MPAESKALARWHACFAAAGSSSQFDARNRKVDAARAARDRSIVDSATASAAGSASCSSSAARGGGGGHAGATKGEVLRSDQIHRFFSERAAGGLGLGARQPRQRA
jgi:hypothetical protein